MKNFFVLLVLSVLVVACGSNTGSPVAGGPVAPQPNASYGQWDAATVQAFDQSCSQAGGQGFSPQQWYLYCDCIAQFSGSKWAFDDFAYNVRYYYYSVIVVPQNGGQSPDNVCLQKASMGVGSGGQTLREVEAAQSM